MEVGDLVNSRDGGVQVNDTLVDAHLVGVPGLGTLTVGGLSGGDLEVLGGESDGTLEADLLGALVAGVGAGALDDISGDWEKKKVSL